MLLMKQAFEKARELCDQQPLQCSFESSSSYVLQDTKTFPTWRGSKVRLNMERLQGQTSTKHEKVQGQTEHKSSLHFLLQYGTQSTCITDNSVSVRARPWHIMLKNLLILLFCFSYSLSLFFQKPMPLFHKLNACNHYKSILFFCISTSITSG